MSEGFLLHDKFSKTCQANADRIAFVEVQPDQTKTYSYSEIHRQARNIASWLIENGIKRQDRIAIILDNCPQWSIAYFGILLAGATAVPLDAKLSDFEFHNLLIDCEAKIIFSSAKFLNFFEKEIINLAKVKKIVLVDKTGTKPPYVHFQDVISKSYTENSFPSVSIEDLSSIIYTSGTVGKPKGVMLSHKNFSANFLSFEKLNICSQRDCFISILPLHHSFAFSATLTFPIFLGAKIVYPYTLKSEEFLKTIRENAVTMFIGVPEIFNMLHKAIFDRIKRQSSLKRILFGLLINFSFVFRSFTKINLAKIFFGTIHRSFGGKIRYLVSGGAKLDTKIAKDFLRLGFTILEGYGLTETSPVVSLNLAAINKLGSVGRPVYGVKVKIGTDNEILIQGDNVMKGYYNKLEETSQVIKDSWFYSGDAGRIDKDGYIYITGRLKEIIVLSSGKNIYPEEIESYFKKSEFIKDICLLSVKNTEGNEILAAVVVPDFEQFKKVGDANVNRKIKWELENLSVKLPSYKRITDFFITKEELPKTRLGKIKRYEVEAKYRDKFSGKRWLIEEASSPSLEDVNILNSEIGKKVMHFLSKKASSKKDIKLEDHLELDLGFDSLARVELAMGLQNIFKVIIPDSLVTEIFTVRELILKLNDFLFSSDSSSKIGQAVRSWKDLLDLPPPKELIEKMNFSPGGFNKLLSFVIPKILFVMFKLFFFLKIEGRQNLPAEGGYVLCSNHSSYLDGFIVGSSVPFKTLIKLYFLGDKNIFEHRMIRWALTIARLVPIDPTKELMNTLQVSSYILRHDKMLCIFPEGLRSFEGKPGEFKKGIGILAKEFSIDNREGAIKIIPVAILGTFDAWPRIRHIPRPHRVKIVFGKPITSENLLSKGKEYGIVDDYEAISFAIKKEVEELFYKNYDGYQK